MVLQQQVKIQTGTVIGKALQNYDSDEIGEIEIVVGKL